MATDYRQGRFTARPDRAPRDGTQVLALCTTINVLLRSGHAAKPPVLSRDLMVAVVEYDLDPDGGHDHHEDYRHWRVSDVPGQAGGQLVRPLAWDPTSVDPEQRRAVLEAAGQREQYTRRAEQCRREWVAARTAAAAGPLRELARRQGEMKTAVEQLAARRGAARAKGLLPVAPPVRGLQLYAVQSAGLQRYSTDMWEVMDFSATEILVRHEGKILLEDEEAKVLTLTRGQYARNLCTPEEYQVYFDAVRNPPASVNDLAPLLAVVDRSAREVQFRAPEMVFQPAPPESQQASPSPAPAAKPRRLPKARQTPVRASAGLAELRAARRLARRPLRRG